MDLLGALGVLVRVVETGSFSAVARERELTQAAVARQVSQLEDHFGVRLFHRTTRKLSLTDDGEMLLGLARPVLNGIEAMEAALGQQSALPVGLVRVGATVTSMRFLSQRLPALLADHPGLKVELVVGDRLGDMIEDRLDLAMRFGEITDTSLVARRSGTAVRVAAAAPSYIERHGEPSSPPISQTTPALCTMSDRIRTCGPLSCQTAPRIFGCRADFLETTRVRCISPREPATASPISLWSKWPMTSAVAGWFAY
jgi:DNA-binding transcriptional LysR family regulator